MSQQILIDRLRKSSHFPDGLFFSKILISAIEQPKNRYPHPNLDKLDLLKRGYILVFTID
jgi:hypothetical protein